MSTSSVILPPPRQSNKKRKRSSKSQKRKSEDSIIDDLSFLSSTFTENNQEEKYDNPFKSPQKSNVPNKPEKEKSDKNKRIQKKSDKLDIDFVLNFDAVDEFPVHSTTTNTIDGNTISDKSDDESSESDHDQSAKNDNLARKYVTKKIEKINEKIKKYQDKLKVLKEKKSLYLNQLSPDEQNKINQAENEENEENDKSSKRETEMVNAIEFMKKGCSMLKYGRFGYPHFRHFELSEDGNYLIWYSSSKSLDTSRITLSSVVSLQKGQLTSTFKRHLQPRLASCSFSIIYENGAKTLDVITKNKNSFLIWTKGLEKLIEYNNLCKTSHEIIEFPKEIWVKIIKRNQESIQRRLSLQPDPPRKMVQKELEITTKKFSSLFKTCNNSKYGNVPEMDKVRCRLVELEQDVESIKHSFNTKKLNVASHEIWRCSVELKALDNKIKAISKTYKL